MRLPYISRNIAVEALWRRLLRDETQFPVSRAEEIPTFVRRPPLSEKEEYGTSQEMSKSWSPACRPVLPRCSFAIHRAIPSKSFQIISYIKKRIYRETWTDRYCWFKREYIETEENVFLSLKDSVRLIVIVLKHWYEIIYVNIYLHSEYYSE